MRHTKQKRHGGARTAALAVVILLLMAVLAGGAWVAWPYAQAYIAPTSAAVQVQGRVKGLVVHTAKGALSADTPEALAQQIAQQVSFAAQNGVNALYVEAAVPSAQAKSGYEVLYRDRAFGVYDALKQQDSFWHRQDAMRMLCDAAAEQNIAVYALMPAETAQNEALKKSMHRMLKKYPLAGAYAYDKAAWAAASVSATLLQPLSAGAPALPTAGLQTWQSPSDVFLATLEPGFAGIAIGDYAQAVQFPDVFSVMLSALDDSAAAPGVASYVPQGKLEITYPADGAKISTARCFIMGVSAPGEALTMNGTEVARMGKTGAFGVLVDLQEGENTFAFAQAGGAQTVLKIEKPAPKPGVSDGGAPKHDNTESVPIGSYVQTTGWINSILANPADDGAISETVRGGTLARVTDCVETKRKGKTTWAYQLASGDFVLAYNTTPVGSAPRASFTGATAVKTQEGETLTFSGSGQPLAYVTRDGTALVLHLYDTDLAPDFAVTGSTMVRGAHVKATVDDAVELTLGFTDRLYGADLTFENGTIVLQLKETPVRSTVQGKPLQGVSVLLDAGHGADDMGAIGVAGQNAPMEKDVNLSVTLAAKYRLEQMGATVHTVRTDDTFLSLEERNKLIYTTQPDYFIAIHHNSVELTTDANNSAGVEAYYFYEGGKTFAQALAKNIADKTLREMRGAKWGYYYVTRDLTCPAVLLETGFMVNPAEYESVTDARTIWVTGDAIAMSVLECTALPSGLPSAPKDTDPAPQPTTSQTQQAAPEAVTPQA